MRDPYTVLGIHPDADEREVKRAYKKLAVQHHPDRSNDPDAAQRFKEVGTAYAVLTNERERQRYLRQRRRQEAEQAERRRRYAEDGRRRAEAAQSQAATAAEQVFWDYARQVRERRAQRQQPITRPRPRTMQETDRWPQFFGAAAVVVLMAVYVWRSVSGLPLQPWLPAGPFATHSLSSPIWITLFLATLMVVKPRWFLIPFLIDGVRDVRLAGWSMILLFPLLSSGLLKLHRLMD